MIFYLDFRDAECGGAVTGGYLRARDGSCEGTEAEDLLLVASHVIVATHGFNVSRTDGQQEVGDFATELVRNEGDAIVAVLWPGDARIGAASYPGEGQDADDSAAALADYLDRVLQLNTAISFVSHSLGARVVFGAIKRLDQRKFDIRQVCVMAAAVDDSSVSDPDVYRNAAYKCTRVYVLGSKKDKVLRWAYPIGDFVQSLLFFWKDAPGGALGRNGPRSSHDLQVPENVVYTIVDDKYKVDHGDYLFAKTPKKCQHEAARFVDAVLAGDANVVYGFPV